MANLKRTLAVNRRLALNTLAVVVSVIATVVVLAVYLQGQLTNSMRQSTEITFSAVYEAAESEFTKVIDICDSVCSDPFLIEALEHEADDAEGFRAKIAPYLASNSQRYNLSTMYLVSDRSMRYYLPDGSFEVLDPEHNEWDNWYTSLVESDDDYHVDVDVDKHNTNEWTIFVDWRIVGEDGATLGIAGAGINMDSVEKIARYYSNTFGMDVSFTSADGTAYVGTDQSSVTQAHRNVSSNANNEAVTTTTPNSCVVSRQVPLVDWYLVVENSGGITESMLGLIILSVVLMAASLLVVVALNGRMFSHERKELTHRANTDALTGLLNRAGLEGQAQTYLADDGGKNTGCLIAIDIDHFKEVNDTFGHAVGDEILREMASVLRGVFRESDLIARPGGDEFSVFLPAMESVAALERRADELLERGRLSYKRDDGDEVCVTLSFGIARAPQDGKTFDELNRAADAALYKAKNAGRDCYRFA